MIEQPPQFNVFRQMIFREDGCIQWTGGFFSSGYPKVNWKRRTRRAHRWIYEEIVGKIPAAMHLHHICENKWCMNPAHLELITPGDHNRLHKTKRA